jgi:hypothetical protein
MSIVELAAHLDAQNKLDFQRRIEELQRDDQVYKPPLRDAQGNLIEEKAE